MAAEIETVTLAEKTISWIIIAAVFGGYWVTRAWDYLKAHLEGDI